ncbi:MAG: BlaI/MecI/CopY family transcriptional regulator [Candidatus Marinimicrobia bacterium]|nr:BlaI/MecI/CopY family transcriptional regulator [Candidatus Neomarinimicrobiota bacterium]
MIKKNKLTPAEWEIMEVIWKTGNKVSIRDVLDTAFSKGEKAYTTIQTIMNILVKKNLLKAEKIGLVNFYTPTISREDMVNKEVKTVASRIFNGSLPAMASFLLKSDTITQEEIDEIKKIINEKEKELKEA